MNNGKTYADCSIEKGQSFLMQKIISFENENKGIAGEWGESGEKPHECLRPEGARKGEFHSYLLAQTHKQPEYPIDALDSLIDVCAYMRDEMQLPVETSGQALLSVASLLTQGLYDVETLAGIKPLSLNFLTLADSGDGKSTADGIALKKISDADQIGHKDYTDKIILWNALPKKERESEPQPLAPYRILKSGTIQGIVRSFKEGVSSQGSFTSEAASMLAGWGMTREQKLNTLAGLNDFWDGAAVSIVRQGEGRTQFYDKRLCCHWLIQPSAARESLNDEIFSTIGTWPRFLVAWPLSMNPREYKRFSPQTSEVVSLFWERCDVILNQRYSVPEGRRKVVSLSNRARSLLIKFWEAMEKSRDPSSEYYSLKPFCVRGAEQVCRIAGVLAAFRNHSAGKTDFEVLDGDLSNGIKLFVYSLETWLGIFGAREDNEHQSWADDLYVWMKKRPEKKATEIAMLRLATPKKLRSKHVRDVAISILQSDGRIRRVVEILPNGAQRLSSNEWAAV
jgi:Protein of unknown function (DUF3987)